MTGRNIKLIRKHRHRLYRLATKGGSKHDAIGKWRPRYQGKTGQERADNYLKRFWDSLSQEQKAGIRALKSIQNEAPPKKKTITEKMRKAVGL